MLRQLATALVPILVCILIQTSTLVFLFRTLKRAEQRVDESGDLYAFRLLLRVAVVIVAQHWAQGMVWALIYFGLGCFQDIQTALYYSLSSYTAAGYGDVMLPHEWRDLGPLEAVNGILMFGWSAGFIFAIVVRLFTGRTIADDAE